jgi:hypothetical protein
MRGSCLCGGVIYEVDRLDMPIMHCHCETCRKAHAAAFTSTAGVYREHFRWLQGENLLSSYESSIGKQRFFCSVCGSHLIAERQNQSHIILRVATLDEDPNMRPVAHAWTQESVPWLQDDNNLQNYALAPPTRSDDCEKT